MKKSGIEERDDRKVAGGCIPVRRKIASGGKEGSYADARTGGKQAYLALKKAKPPGSAGGWTKKNCICCHKCKNDRSAPNGFVCMNPEHLYWGSKADNTYDQNRGNGWAAENKKSLEENTYLKGDRVMKISRVTLRKMINEMIKDPYAMDPNVQQSGPTDFKKAPWMQALYDLTNNQKMILVDFGLKNNLGLDQINDFLEKVQDLLRDKIPFEEAKLIAFEEITAASRELY